MTSDAALAEALEALERQLLDPELRKSQQFLESVLADDFKEFGASGRVYDRRKVIESLLKETPSERSLTDFQAIALGPNVILATYRATEGDSASLRSSIWVLRESRWTMTFHQGTPTQS